MAPQPFGPEGARYGAHTERIERLISEGKISRQDADSEWRKGRVHHERTVAEVTMTQTVETEVISGGRVIGRATVESSSYARAEMSNQPRGIAVSGHATAYATAGKYLVFKEYT